MAIVYLCVGFLIVGINLFIIVLDEEVSLPSLLSILWGLILIINSVILLSMMILNTSLQIMRSILLSVNPQTSI